MAVKWSGTNIAAQYELSAGAEARPFFGTPIPVGNIFRTFPMVLPDLTAGGANRPTITLQPADDGSTVRRFPTPPATEVRVVPRSTAQVLAYLSNGMEVPAEHVAAGLARPVTGPDGTPFDPAAITRGLFAVRVCGGHKPPPTDYVAVRYRGH